MTTLKEAIEAISAIQIISPRRVGAADELLGKYKGIIPKDKTSTGFIRRLRDTFYGKIQ